MKKLLIIFLLLPVFLLFSYDKKSFDRIVDFSADLKVLSEIDSTGRGDSGKLFVIDGSISSIHVINKNKDSFEAVIELVAGEWTGLEDVAMYNAYVRVKGSKFFDRFPSRRDTPGPDSILQNIRIIVVGSLSKDCANIPAQKKTCLEAYYIRVIK